MRQKIGVWIAALLLILPSAAMALGLGRIELKSALNQPLDGEISLLSVRAKDLEHLKVKLASSTDFKRAGIERPYFLSRIKFEIVENKNKNKKYIVKLTSKDSIQEPFLNFLVEVRWANGKMLREFTVLLDPPVTVNSYQRPGAKVAQESLASERTPAKITKKPTKPKKKTASKGVGVSKRPKFTTTSNKVSKKKSSRSQTGAASGKHSVKRGQTLWKIARSVRDKDTQSVEQMMMALYKNNPEAFSKDNINSLLAGRVLNLPSEEQVQQLNDSQAKLAVRDQARAWRKGLSSPSTGKATKKGSAKTKPAATKIKPKSKGRIEVVAPSDETVAGDKSIQASGKVDANDKKEVSRLRSDLAAAQKAVEEQKSKNDDIQSNVNDMQGKIKSLERLLALKDQEMAKLQSRIAGGEQPQVEVVAEEVEVKVQEPEVKTEEAKLEETKPAEDQTQVKKPEEVEKAEVEPVEEAKPEQQLPVEPKRPEPKAPVMPTDVKAEVKSTLMDDPKVWAIASGVILALLILVWIIIRSMFKRVEISDEELEAHGVSTVITSVESDDEETPAYFDKNTESQPDPQSEEQEDQVEGEEDYAEVFEEEESDEEDEPSIIREADVYVAYGRTAQAVEKLEKAISENPENGKIRYKLLEVLSQSGEAEQFDKQAKAYFDLINDPSDESWLEIVEMGQKLSPESPLYKEAGSIMEAEDLSIDELLEDEDLGDDDLGMDLSDDLLGEEDTGLSVGETFAEPVESDRDIIEELSEGEELESVDNGDFDMSLDFEVTKDESESIPIPHEDEQKLAYETSDSDIEELADLEFELDSIDEEVVVENDAGDLIGSDTVGLDGGMEESAYPEDEIVTEEEGEASLESLGDIDLEDLGGDFDADLAELDDLSDLSDLDIGDEDLGLGDFDSEDDDLVIEDSDAVGTKLDLAKAYIDMGDSDGANSILSEVVLEGSDDQKKEAQELIDKL